MKGIIRHYIFDVLSLYLVTKLVSGMVFNAGLQTLLITAFGLTIAGLFIRPVVNLLLLPINLVTFGLFRWATSAITLYIVTLVIEGFEINFFRFDGILAYGFDIPAFQLTGIMALVAYSFLLSTFASSMHWLVK